MANIKAVVVILATLAALAVFSMPLPQQASAQDACQEKGNPGKGATVTKCDFRISDGEPVVCTLIDTASGLRNTQCHINPLQP